MTELIQTGQGQIHLLKQIGVGLYPACNPGLMAGVDEYGIVLFYGKWHLAEGEVSCSKCKAKQPKVNKVEYGDEVRSSEA